MSKPSTNLQDGFLNQVRKENQEVKFILIGGGSLIGQVRGFDNFTVSVFSRGTQHLVYKHAIAQIILRQGSPRRDKGEGDKIESGAAGESAAPPEERKKKSSSFNQIDLGGINLKADESAGGEAAAPSSTPAGSEKS